MDAKNDKEELWSVTAFCVASTIHFMHTSHEDAAKWMRRKRFSHKSVQKCFILKLLLIFFSMQSSALKGIGL